MRLQARRYLIQVWREVTAVGLRFPPLQQDSAASKMPDMVCVLLPGMSKMSNMTSPRHGRPQTAVQHYILESSIS